MQLIQEPNWPSLSREHRALLVTAGQALAEGDFAAAAGGYERAYRLLRERLADWEVVPVPYKDMSELEATITAWLPRMT
jgi:hypothetical protein